MLKKILFLLLVLFLLVSPLSAGGNRWTSKPPVGSTINWSHPLSKGLVGCWLMNEGGGLKVNDIARGNNGTIVNGALWKPTLKGIGLDFDGTDDKVTVVAKPAINNIWNNGGTLSLWINLDAYNGNLPGYIIQKDIPGNGWFLGTINDGGANNNSIQFLANFSGGDNNWLARDDMVTNFWVHIVITYNASSVNNDPIFYKNGIVLIIDSTTRSTGTKDSDTTGNLSIGGRLSDNQRQTNGKISNILLYNRALSPQEIQTLYQDPYQFIKPPTIWSNFSTAVAAARRFFMFD